MSAGDTRVLNRMPAFTKCQIGGRFTGKHDFKTITSLSLALHSYSSHAVMALKNKYLNLCCNSRSVLIIVYIKW